MLTHPSGPHFIVKHIYGVSQSSYVVDVHMDECLSHYCQACQPSLWKVSRILGTSKGQTIEGIALVEAIPIQDGPHFIVKHIEGAVSQYSHAVDVHMDESLSHYCQACQPSLRKVPIILGTSREANNSVFCVQKLQAHPRWLPLHCQTHIKCIVTFICCGCAYG